MTIAQLADQLGVDEGTVHRMIETGKLAAQPLAGVWSVDHRALAAVQRRVSGTGKRDRRELLEE